MARLTAILLLACAACLLSWTAATGAAKAPAGGVVIDGVAVSKMVPVAARELVRVKSLTVFRAVGGEDSQPCIVISGSIVLNIKDWDCNVILSIAVCPTMKPNGGIKYDTQPTVITIRKPAFGVETKFAAVANRPGTKANDDDALGYTVGARVTAFQPPPLRGEKNLLNHGKVAPGVD